MSSAYLLSQLIVVEPYLNPKQCLRYEDKNQLLKMYEPKDPACPSDDSESMESGTGSEPGIEFLKGPTTDTTTAVSEAQLLPLIHNLPGATTIYNSYKSVFQNWKNSTPKLVQYAASDLEVVVYRKNGQVDTFRTGTSSNDQKQVQLDNGAEKVPSIDSSRILSVGLKQVELDTHSTAARNENNILYQSSSSPPTPPPASPFPPSEFRYLYNQNQGACGSSRNGEDPLADAAKSKLIPDVEGMVIDFLKPSEQIRASHPSSLVQEIFHNNIRCEHEPNSAKDTKTKEVLNDSTTTPILPLIDGGRNSGLFKGKNCRFMVYGPQPRQPSIDELQNSSAEVVNVIAHVNESKTETIKGEEPAESSPPFVDLCNGNIPVGDHSELQTCSTMIQTTPFELAPASTQTDTEETQYEDFSCQVEVNPVVLEDAYSQCETDCAEFACQVEMKLVVSDSYSQCETDCSEFSCQAETKPVVSDSYSQCETDCSEFSCQAEMKPVVSDACVQCTTESTEFSCQAEMKPVVIHSYVQCTAESTDFSGQAEMKAVVSDSYVQCTTELTESSCQAEVISKETAAQCAPEYVSKEIQTGLCCQKYIVKMNKAYLQNTEKYTQNEMKKLENTDEDELSEEKIYATINRFVMSQRSSKDSMDELEKEVENLKEVVQQSSISFGLNESSEYFEDVWLPSDGKDEGAEAVPDFE